MTNWLFHKMLTGVFFFRLIIIEINLKSIPIEAVKPGDWSDLRVYLRLFFRGLEVILKC